MRWGPVRLGQALSSRVVGKAEGRWQCVTMLSAGLGHSHGHSISCKYKEVFLPFWPRRVAERKGWVWESPGGPMEIGFWHMAWGPLTML